MENEKRLRRVNESRPSIIAASILNILKIWNSSLPFNSNIITTSTWITDNLIIKSLLNIWTKSDFNDEKSFIDQIYIVSNSLKEIHLIKLKEVKFDNNISSFTRRHNQINCLFSIIRLLTFYLDKRIEWKKKEDLNSVKYWVRKSVFDKLSSSKAA